MMYGPNPAYGSQKRGHAFVFLFLDWDKNDVGNSRMTTPFLSLLSQCILVSLLSYQNGFVLVGVSLSIIFQVASVLWSE